jgi:protein TonB
VYAEADRERNWDRIKSAMGAATFHALLGYAFLTGLGFDVAQEVSDELKMFDVTEDLPPPPAELPPPDEAQSERNQTKDPEGAASPANLENTPSPIVAPPPEIRLEVPSPVIAAPAAGQGSAAEAGATNIPGPGTGSGGVGTGLGSGLYGSGTGGGGGGRFAPARWISGSIGDSDYPPASFERELGGTVFMRFTVRPNGRVTDCRVTRSSGQRDLDVTTCRLIERRFRYRPARDARGRPIASEVRGQHEWIAERRTTLIEIEEPPQE